MLLIQDSLSKAIKDILINETKLRIAVAFIGNGACKLINPNAEDVKIICNLTMGGTNPNEVEELIKRFKPENIKQIDNLHAKLYIGTEHAIVGSANMSANGLGNQPNGLREAGYKFELTQADGKNASDWFNEIWKKAKKIKPEDLADAKEKWKRRSLIRNGDWKADSLDICDYDFDRDDFPLITFCEDSDWEVADHLKKGKNKKELKVLEIDIENSVEIDRDDDRIHLEKKGRYIFTYYRSEGICSAERSDDFSIVRSKGVAVLNAWRDDEDDKGTYRHVMLCDEVKNCIFGFDDKKIYDQFRDLINGEKYQFLRKYKTKNGVGECWFHDRIELTRTFWKEFQSNLCKLNGQNS